MSVFEDHTFIEDWDFLEKFKLWVLSFLIKGPHMISMNTFILILTPAC